MIRLNRVHVAIAQRVAAHDLPVPWPHLVAEIADERHLQPSTVEARVNELLELGVLRLRGRYGSPRWRRPDSRFLSVTVAGRCWLTGTPMPALPGLTRR